jgi:serine/threonine-protein kinase
MGFRPKLLDFGIAKLTDIGLAGTATKTGAVMGTPTYMSPEQCKGTGDVDARADLYSIGCIFYELVTGRPPFTSLGAGELIGAHIYAAPEKPSVHGEVGAETEALIMSLLEKKPDKRPQTARELGQKLSVLAQQLGWITTTTPTGLTENVRTPVVLDENMIATEPPERDAPKTTPFGSWLQPSQAEVVDKPTTLSGAASQSVVDMKRSRKGIAIAMVTSALLAGGVVAFVKLRESGSAPAAEPAKPAIATPDPVPVAKPAIATPDPVPVAKPEPKPEQVAKPEPKPEPEPPEVKPEPEGKPEPIAKTEPVKKPIKKPVVKKPPKLEKPPEKKPDPPKPDPKKCDQPPCIEREGP